VRQSEDRGGLNTTIAILVAVAASFVALCNVKDGNIVQAMAQAQANSVDAWSYYQAKSTKQHIAEGMIDEDRPYSQFLGRASNPDYDYGFWHHSTGLYRELMAILGFRLSGRRVARYRCNVLDAPNGVEITTLVFDRIET